MKHTLGLSVPLRPGIPAHLLVPVLGKNFEMNLSMSSAAGFDTEVRVNGGWIGLESEHTPRGSPGTLV
jgi:hypothetical protein